MKQSQGWTVVAQQIPQWNQYKIFYVIGGIYHSKADRKKINFNKRGGDI